ncbi:MAG TPA: c-type cytochrome domain-containing protein [Pedobacter sp.]|jgi:uncharacterized membrane protein
MDNLIELIGRFHPLVVHLPIGILLLAVSIEFYIKFKKDPYLTPFLPLLWGVGFASSVLACIMGYMLKLGGGYEESALDLHQNFGIALAVITGVIFFSIKSDFIRRIKFPFVVVSTFLLFGVGHFGGNLTHGEDYLTQPLQAMLGNEPKRIPRKPVVNIEEAVVYLDVVEPILYNKCQKCHTSSKKKGDLRLDLPELILKGGEHGPVIVAGNSASSEIYTRLLLPEEDDKRMPPKGKTEMSDEEIQIIKWWIDEGKADFNVKVAQLTKNDGIKSALAKLSKGSAEQLAENENSTKVKSEIPTAKVTPANATELAALEKQGVVFSPLTPDNTFLAVNLVNNPNFSDAQMETLLKFKEQILWLDLSDTKITDNSLKYISQFKNLTRLILDNTAITDAGLKHIKALPRLRHLNLYHTNITDSGLKSLSNCKELTTLHLWETKVTANGIESLKKSLGEKIEVSYESGT